MLWTQIDVDCQQASSSSARLELSWDDTGIALCRLDPRELIQFWPAVCGDGSVVILREEDFQAADALARSILEA